MKKRVLSLFMALALCLTLLPTAALAEENTTEPSTQLTEPTPVPQEPKTPDQGENTETPDQPEEPSQDEPPAADEQPAVQSEPAPQAAVQAAEVPAENAVAQVGNVNYANITDAFAAVKQSDGGTLTLLANCQTPNTNEPFDISGNYTLDLNGCTLTGRLYLSKTSTSLTVKDSSTGGKIQATAGWSPLWVYGGDVTIESGTLATEKENVQALVFGDNDACKTLTITGGSFETGFVNIGASGGKTVISGGAFHELRVNGDSKRATLSGGTFDTVMRRKSGSTIAPTDLLADGYAFVDRGTGTEVSTSQVDALTNVRVVSKETVNALVSLTVDGTKTHYYGTFEEALTAAQQTQGGTLTLLNNVTTTQSDINSGTFTLDLNGQTLTGKYYNTLVVSGGSLTIQDSKGGVISSTISDGRAVLCCGGNVTILGGSFPSALYWESGTVSLRGGEFRSLDSKAGSWLSAIPEGKALKKKDGSVVDASANELTTEDGFYVLADHEKHDWQAGKCACGRSCDHAGKVDHAGYCTRCQMLVEAFETGGKRYTSLENALAAAQDGDTITLRGPLDIENAKPIEISKNIILNLNGHALRKSREEALLCILGSNVVIANGTVRSTCTSKSAVAVEVGKFDHTGAKLTLDNVTLEGSIGGGIDVRGRGLFICSGNEAVVMSGKVIGGIYTEGTLTMSGGSAEQLELGLLDNISVTLSGGSFGSIKIKKDADYQSLLAGGYAYQKQGGALLQLSEMKENTAVTVVKCSHPDDHSGGTVCPYCGCAAEVTKKDGSISYHRTTGEAIAAAGGGTVKLLANAGELTIGSPLKLDLNGKTAAKLTVTGEVTLASLLPKGCAFKSGTTWITDLTGTELTNVSVARLPIQSMNYPTKMGMDYGGMGTLLVNVNGTGAVTFQWYKVEDGKETAVGSATTSNQFDLSTQRLSAGQHTFRFSATCDGYEKMSQDIVVTVQRANISASLITSPTARENLTYTGQEQALITAGSVTSGGTMQYSLTENGTYSETIPTGTNAGAYTVWYRAIGDENHNDTAPDSVAVRIGQKPLTINGVTAASKPYDGTTDADITSVTFEGSVTLQKDKDYTVTASFDDASADNGKNVTATVTLLGQTAKNYFLEQSSFHTTGNITKAAAPDFTKETALVIVNGHEKTYTVTLPTLPTLETHKEYGAPTYELGEIKLNAGYYTGGAKVENGALTLPIQENDVETTGPVGTVTVVIKSANYEDITLTVNVSAKNRITPTGTPTLSKNAIIYGDALNTIALSGKLHDNVNNVDVDGTFEWVDGTHIPVVGNGTYAAEWIFEPTDTEKYLTVSGRSNITVEKATQYGKVSMAGYTYGQAPSTPTLTDRTGDANAQVTYRYSTAGSGSVQTWDIQNPPALNAGTYRMYASIGDTDNYYGFEAVYCEFVVAKATPTYTAPTGLTAKYGQTLADVTLPDGWSWMDSSESVGGASTAAKTFQAKFTPKDTENYNTVENIELEVTVNKADGGNLKTVELEQKYTDASDHTYTPDWAGLPAGQDWTFSSEASIVLSKQDFAADGSLLTYAISGGKAGDKITIALKASCDNYKDFTITLNVTLTEKDDQKPLTITGAGSVVYGQTLTLTTTGGSGTGTVTYRIDTDASTGEATIDPETGVLTPVKVGSVSVIATKAGDNDYNDVTSAPFVLMIKPATPTGEPNYTKITTSGKTLKDAALTTKGSTLNPSDGKLEWVDDKGNVLPDSTRVEANTTYKWHFTPTDTNYTTLTGEVELYHKSSSGGGWYDSYYTIKATAGAGGSISPSGNVSVREGRDQPFTITPDKGYAVANVKIDGKSIGAVKSYTFENVSRTHTIEVIFMKANGNPQTGVFVDVATGSYYEDAVDWAVENGITQGTDDTHFAPDGICTRAQAVAFLWRAAGSPKLKTRTMPFTDVPAGSYYYDAVLWAVENGIAKGTSDTTFSPNMTCSRAQIVTFLWRSEKSPAAGTANPFADVKSTAYYAGAVLWAVKEDITKGTTNTTFSPDADCTRAQIVTFLWRCKK